jgi:hypothetical protein
MKLSGIPIATTPAPTPTREQMMAVAAARPAVLQHQEAALAAIGRGTSGQGTPALDSSAEVDLYA